MVPKIVQSPSVHTANAVLLYNPQSFGFYERKKK